MIKINIIFLKFIKYENVINRNGYRHTYINLNIEKRKNAENEFEKDFFKQINNFSLVCYN